MKPAPCPADQIVTVQMKPWVFLGSLYLAGSYFFCRFHLLTTRKINFLYMDAEVIHMLQLLVNVSE